MATVSSHVLDSVLGTHASGIRVECFSRDATGSSTLVFDCVADAQGRIKESIQLDDSASAKTFELVFHAKDYFETLHGTDDGEQIMEVVLVRLALSNNTATYHVPMMLSPHSYSVWWSDSARNTH